MFDHGQRGFGLFIRAFKWAKGNYENPGCESSTLLLSSFVAVADSSGFQGFSWLTRPFAWYFLRSAKAMLTDIDTIGLIFCSRVALTMWEGVRETQWSFLSPPWQLRDKGEPTT